MMNSTLKRLKTPGAIRNTTVAVKGWHLALAALVALFAIGAGAAEVRDQRKEDPDAGGEVRKPPQANVGPTRTPDRIVQAIDLRSSIKRMTRKEGSNIVHKGAGHKLVAEVKNAKIARWSAMDDKGNSLPIRVMAGGVRCKVCVRAADTEICYEISCDDAAIPKDQKATQQ